MNVMVLIVVVGIGFVSPGSGLAQVIRLKGGADGEKSLPFADRYQYPQFIAGKVLFQNGTMAAGRFNYNVLLGEMQFIDPHGDTLALVNEPLIRLVGIDVSATRQDVFWYDPSKGYLNVVADYPAVKLAVRQGLKTVKNEKTGAYEQSSGASAVTNYQFYSGGNTSVRKLDTKGDVLLIKEKTYVIIDQNGRLYPANKASVLKLFSKHKQAMTTYLASEPVDFSQEESLKNVLKYGSELL